MRNNGARSPYTYEAAQTFTLDGATLTLGLEVANWGATALPFGLGWHPYFPWPPARRCRRPRPRCGSRAPIGCRLKGAPCLLILIFRTARELPRRWVNRGFEGWNGACEIVWPNRLARLRLDADALFGRYFLFVSDPNFDAGYKYEYFAFEPMSHSANAHNLPDDAGLLRLAPGESLSGKICLTAEL